VAASAAQGATAAGPAAAGPAPDADASAPPAAAGQLAAAVDQARKDGAEVAIYTALSMLIGAFIASAAAALGGRLRDQHV
jgi:hypothetical protein